MKIGIGTYALFWEAHERNPSPLSTEDMISRAAELGCDVFQICDDPRMARIGRAELVRVAEYAKQLGVELELGTRGTSAEHLAEFIDKANLLGARVLRSMVQRSEIEGGLSRVIEDLRGCLERLESRDVTLALETYEQIATEDLVAIVRAVNSSRVGVCLDPANCVSALEHPKSVIDLAAPWTTNLHVKDFAFSRNEGWVGFLYAGAEIGSGLLDLDYELAAVYSSGKTPAAIVEHWVPWQGDIEQTIALERQWTAKALTALRMRRR